MNSAGEISPRSPWNQRTSRLDRDHRATVEPDLRLVVDDQLAALQAPCAAGSQDQALEGGRVHIGGIELIAAAECSLAR